MLGDSPTRKVKIGSVMVTPLTDAELAEMDGSMNLDVDARLHKKLSPSEEKLLLNPQQVVGSMALEVVKALTAAAGVDVQTLPPLKIGVDGGWSVPWESQLAVTSLNDKGKFQTTLNLFCFDYMGIDDDSICPEINGVFDQADYFYTQPKDCKFTIEGRFNPDCLSKPDEESGTKKQKTADAQAAKKQPKTDATKESDSESSTSTKYLLLPPVGSIKLTGSQTHVWALIVGMYRWHRAGKDMKLWLPVIQSTISCVYKAVDGTQSQLDTITDMINGDQELHKRAKTEALRGTDKAGLFHMTESLLTKKHRKKATHAVIIEFLSKCSWDEECKDGSRMDNPRSLTALNKIYLNVVADQSVLECLRVVDYYCGPDFLNSTWNLDAICNCLPTLSPTSLKKFFKAAMVSLRRGDIATVKSMSVKSMRSGGGTLGSVAQLGYRLEMLEHELAHFPFCEKLQQVFSDLESVDEMYPSRKQLDRNFAEGKTSKSGHMWITRLATQLDIAGEPYLKKIAVGGFDGDLKEKYAGLKGKNVTLEKLMQAENIESARQVVIAAWDKDKAKKTQPTCGGATVTIDDNDDKETQKKNKDE